MWPRLASNDCTYLYHIQFSTGSLVEFYQLWLCKGIIGCYPCPLLELFAAEEGVGEPSVHGMVGDGPAVAAPGPPTAWIAVTLRTECLTRFGVERFPGGKHRSCASTSFTPCLVGVVVIAVHFV